MIITIPDTNATGIHMALVEARHNIGVASSMVFTMIVIAEARHYDRALAACHDAGREHPSRIILVTNGDADGDRVDAEIRLGEEVPGEIISLRFHGELTEHRASVVLPLLLPDSPVVAWWTGKAPDKPGEDPLGKLAIRRITDAMGSPRPLAAIERRARNYCPGDTDLTWTRLTPWRALLAAALDSYPAPITAVSVEAAPNNAASMLLSAWLEDRLGVQVDRREGDKGIGVTNVTLSTTKGDIVIAREDGKTATFSAPGLSRRQVALRRREINALITEELRRLDVDDIFASAMRTLVERCERRDAEQAATR
ncbi:MAG: glucose-6-phosphate dehydrogenase assembly protein OpcA [Micropruina sp.]|uniref:glucose-6-phosphate dehydrogenase assembly protein OpcA n=1 Tax=Micropruina sp. TaxID=2737536 RepID=UPI0039E5104D